MSLFLINIVIAMFNFILGFLIKKYKLDFLIAGYNTASKEKKELYNKENLVKYVGNLLIFSSLIILIGSLLAISFKNFQNIIYQLTWILFIIFIIISLIYINTTKYVKKN